jgi:glycosyltransferase involved in cell wall biosynthesis
VSGKRILLGPLPPPYGGVAIFMAALSEEASRHDFCIWQTTGRAVGGSGSNRSVNHRRFAHIWALLKEARGARITDSTHFHFEYPHPVLLPIWIAAKRLLGFRWIKVLHDGSLPGRAAKFGYFRRRLFDLALKNLDEIVASNQELADWLQGNQGYRGTVHMIPTLVELPDPERSSTARAIGDTFRADAIVTSIGVFIPSYGFDQVATAIETVRSQLGMDIRLVLVDGQFAKDAEFKNLVLDSRDWIVVLSSVAHEELPDLFNVSDVFVRPFRDESLGLSRVEAIICNVPVIATNVGETRGMLTYEYGDIEMLTSHLRSVLSGSRPPLDHWQAEYTREAKDNRARYIDLITGERDDQPRSD